MLAAIRVRNEASQDGPGKGREEGTNLDAEGSRDEKRREAALDKPREASAPGTAQEPGWMVREHAAARADELVEARFKSGSWEDGKSQMAEVAESARLRGFDALARP